MLNYAVYDLNYDLNTFWDKFLDSEVCLGYEIGDSAIIAGRSGIEMALIVLNINNDIPEQNLSCNITPIYWLGWILSYFHWHTCISFRKLTKYIKLNEMLLMYDKYHEMDERHFVDYVYNLYLIRKKYSNLKIRRLEVGYSQSKLSSISGVPIRTLQQYEQGQKNINNAKAEYVINLSKALFCEPSEILENIIIIN